MAASRASRPGGGRMREMTMMRIEHGWTAVLGLAATLLAWSSAASAQQPLTLESLRQQRRELAFRQRGIIANNDGCDALYYPKDRDLSVPAFLDLRTTGLAGTQVGAVAYCTISSGFSFFTHDTQAGTLLTRQPADYGLLPNTRNVSAELIAGGTDCLRAVVEFCHANRMEAFWSMRMNDTHDVAHTPAKPYLLFPPLKEQHPDWLVGDHLKRTPYGTWSSVDYGRPEVRELAFRYLEEVCRSYDVDGLELDFLRHFCYFRSVAAGGTATADELDALTAFMARVRAMTEEVGLRRGRPILVAIRVPDSVDFCRAAGLDLDRWLADGLADILITTDYFVLNPWSYSVALGHRHQVAVYAGLSESRVTGATGFQRNAVETYRGRAAAAWLAGVDGIYTFNLFNPKSQVFRDIGDRDGLKGKDKLYFVTVRDGDPARYVRDGERFNNLPLLTPQYSAALTQERPYQVELTVADDLAAAERAGRPGQALLHLQARGVARPEELTVTLNDMPLTGGAKDARDWFAFVLPKDCLKVGANRLRVAVATAGTRGEEWPVQYQGSALPPPAWARDPGSARTVAEVVDGALRVADTGEVPGDYLYYRYAWAASPDREAVAEARVKVVSGLSHLIFGNGVATDRLALYPDRIELYSDRKLRWAMDTTDDFHVYRVVLNGGDLKVLVDGELRLDAPGRLKASGTRSPNYLAFGASSSTTLGETLWDYVRARGGSASLMDAVIQIRYP